MRVFLDANVVFSACNAENNIAALITWLKKDGTAVTSDFAIEEARRNLSLKRPNWSPSLEPLLGGIEIVPSILFDIPVPLEEKDQPLLCAAIRNHCDYFATGDRRDFGHLYDEVVEGVRIISLLRLAVILADAAD